MNKKQKKIAILLPSLKFGGAERVSLNLATEMKLQGISIDILVMSKEGEFLAEAERNFAVHDLKCNKTYKLPYLMLLYMIRNQPNVLISNFWKLNISACLTRVLFPFFKLILWEHSPPSKTLFSPTWIYALSASLLYLFASKIVAVSDGVRADIQRYTIGLSGKLITIYNPIIPPDDLLLQNSKISSRNTFQIISLGRLELEKNQALLIQAFALLPVEINATLLMVGDGSQRKKLEQMCIDLNVQEKVKFFGFITDPYQILIKADLLVLPSNFEGFGNVIIEAFYCGLPVVSTDCPYGPRELLMNGKYGSLVPVSDKVAMAKAIQYEHENRRSSELQKFAAQRFLPSVIVKQFLDVMNCNKSGKI